MPPESLPRPPEALSRSYGDRVSKITPHEGVGVTLEAQVRHLVAYASTRPEVVFALPLVAEMGAQNGPRGPSGPTPTHTHLADHLLDSTTGSPAFLLTFTPNGIPPPPGVNGAPPLNLGLFYGVTSLGGVHASTRREVVFAPHLVAEMGAQNGRRGPSGPTHTPSRCHRQFSGQKQGVHPFCTVFDTFW